MKTIKKLTAVIMAAVIAIVCICPSITSSASESKEYKYCPYAKSTGYSYSDEYMTSYNGFTGGYWSESDGGFYNWLYDESTVQQYFYDTFGSDYNSVEAYRTYLYNTYDFYCFGHYSGFDNGVYKFCLNTLMVYAIPKGFYPSLYVDADGYYHVYVNSIDESASFLQVRVVGEKFGDSNTLNTRTNTYDAKTISISYYDGYENDCKQSNDTMFYTNMPIFESKTDSYTYATTGDGSSATNPEAEEEKIGCDSFGWDSFDIVNQGDKWIMNYTYSNDDMINNPAKFTIYPTYYAVLTVKNSLGEYIKYDDNYFAAFSLSNHLNSCEQEVREHTTANSNKFTLLYLAATTLADVLNGTDFHDGEVISSVTYVTVTLQYTYIGYDPVRKCQAIMSVTSSDVRYFEIDNLTGQVTNKNDDVIVNTYTTSDDDGNITGKNVSDITLNDSANSSTIVHYSVSDYNETSIEKNQSNDDNSTDNSTNDNSTDNSNYQSTITNTTTGDTYNTVTGDTTTSSTVNNYYYGSGLDVSDDGDLVVEDDDFKLSDIWINIKSMFGLLDDPTTPEKNDGLMQWVGDAFSWMPSEFKTLVLGGMSSVLIVTIMKMFRH